MLIERRAFEVTSGHIQFAAELVIAVPRTEPAYLVFNELAVEVKIDDTAMDVAERWNAMRLSWVKARPDA